MLLSSRQSHPIPSATWGGALGIAVENRTKGGSAEGVCAARSHRCAREGLSEPWQLVLSHARVVDEFRLCLYLARPHSAAENVPKLLILHFLSCSLVSAAWLPCYPPNAAKASPPEGSSPVKWLGLERKNVKYVIPHSAFVAVSSFSASPLS